MIDLMSCDFQFLGWWFLESWKLEAISTWILAESFHFWWESTLTQEKIHRFARFVCYLYPVCRFFTHPLHVSRSWNTWWPVVKTWVPLHQATKLLPMAPPTPRPTPRRGCRRKRWVWAWAIMWAKSQLKKVSSSCQSTLDIDCYGSKL